MAVTQAGKVFIVDDDPLVRSTLEHALGQAGIVSLKFASAEQLLLYIDGASVGCVVTDLRMPGMSGIELQEELVRRCCPLPVIVMTGFADVPLAVRAIKAGALDILQKPFKNEELFRQVRGALIIAEERASRTSERAAVKRQYDSLSVRESEVFCEIVLGHSNKEIAKKLGLSPRTVESHRARVMEKMQVESVAALIKKAAAIAE